MTTQIAPGLIGEATIVVGEQDLASAHGSGQVHVFATPAMIALMERASLSAVDHLLPEGNVTVGARIDATHVSPTPPGMKVTARAELKTVEGRKLTFHVEAHDEVDKIGEATHERVIVDVNRLITRAQSKAAR
ncbi:MAG: thioesterase family protein [Chloroflexota bacterium]